MGVVRIAYRFMKILLLSYYFPPFNGIGPVRIGKIAKYLSRFGHDVRVVTARDQPYEPNLPVEISPEKAIYASQFNVNKPVALVFGQQGRYGATEHQHSALSRWILRKTRACYRYIYKSVLAFPDEQIGWFPFASRAGRCLIREWKPDLMYACASPYTSLLLAHSLSRKFRIPWVAELRDLWVDHQYYFQLYPFWRRWVERRLERAVIRTATGIVTVSEPLAEVLRKKYGKPTVVVLNGYDPDDYPVRTSSFNANLRIIYTGMIYEGKQDPSPLFRALKELGGFATHIRVAFYGRYLGAARDLASATGVEHLTEFHAQVPYRDSLKLQREADVLLLLLWNDSSEKGVYTGKLFEYIGARRPILAIGPFRDVASDLIERRGAGCVLHEPKDIANQLRKWATLKQTNGSIPDLSESVPEGLSRESQARRLEEFLLDVVKS